jgi:hypothetical protein
MLWENRWEIAEQGKPVRQVHLDNGLVWLINQIAINNSSATRAHHRRQKVPSVRVRKICDNSLRKRIRTSSQYANHRNHIELSSFRGHNFGADPEWSDLHFGSEQREGWLNRWINIHVRGNREVCINPISLNAFTGGIASQSPCKRLTELARVYLREIVERLTVRNGLRLLPNEIDIVYALQSFCELPARRYELKLKPRKVACGKPDVIGMAIFRGLRNIISTATSSISNVLFATLRSPRLLSSIRVEHIARESERLWVIEARDGIRDIRAERMTCGHISKARTRFPGRQAGESFPFCSHARIPSL